MWSLLFFVVLARCQADWAETINLAGMQRTLSQMMTKEFLLISRGSDVEDNKRKLSESMASFDSTLNALLVGDSARGILAAPNQQVVTALENVNAVWVTMEALLRDNVDTVRHADGSLDMIVLEALSTQNVPLLDTSNEVVQAIVDAAKVSGATTNGLVQDIAGRQRTLIQRLAKGILFLAQGVAMSFNMQAYRNTKSLFETSHDGIIQGVPFAGLPVLDKLCTLHQMTEVSFYYAQIRPFLTGITNADTPSASQAAADEVAEEMCELVDPLFDAMVEAVKLFGDDDGNCDPAASMTQNDWLSYFSTLTQQQLLTQQASQYFMQIALRIDVKTSKVEITVLTSSASMNLRNLIEGSKMVGIPAPPSQAVVDLLLKARETWDTLAAEMSQAVHLESISSVTVARVEQLSNYILVDLENVMQLSLSMANVSRAKAIDLASQQARLSSSMTEYACLISSGREVAENWDNLNATRAAFERNRWTLLEGAPATETGPALEKMSDVCMVQQMKEATDLFGELELAALAVSNGDMAALTPLVEVSPRAVKAFEAVLALQGTGTCRNGTLTAEEWIQRHQQVSELAILSQEVSAEFVILQQGKSPNRRQLDSLLLDIEANMRRVLFGSFRPPVAAPQSQQSFSQLLEHSAPRVLELRQLSSSTETFDFITAALRLSEDAQSYQEDYLEKALAADPSWPGRRVNLAMRQLEVVREVFTESILYAADLRTRRDNLDDAVQKFMAAHSLLKDGGSGLPPIMLPERQDLLTQWERVDTAWGHFRMYQQDMTVDDISRTEGAMELLVEELKTMVPLLHIVDVKSAQQFPWSTVIYSSLAAILACCCCFMACRIILGRQQKAAAAVEKAAMSARASAAVADEV